MSELNLVVKPPYIGILLPLDLFEKPVPWAVTIPAIEGADCVTPILTDKDEPYPILSEIWCVPL